MSDESRLEELLVDIESAQKRLSEISAGSLECMEGADLKEFQINETLYAGAQHAADTLEKMLKAVRELQKNGPELPDAPPVWPEEPPSTTIPSAPDAPSAVPETFSSATPLEPASNEVRHNNPFFREQVKDVMFRAVWRDEVVPNKSACCEQSLSGATVVLLSRCVHLQSISHEVHHAVNWLEALGVINGREEAAHHCGQWLEDIVAALRRAGWTYGPKKSEGALWNLDQDVALHAPESA